MPIAGPPTFRIVQSIPGQQLGPEGLEVRVHFEGEEPTAADTFRAFLNGADVTRTSTTASSRSSARLNDLLDGENVLRVERFVWASWPRGV